MQARTILAGCSLASFLACVLNYMSPVVAVLVPLSVSFFFFFFFTLVEGPRRSLNLKLSDKRVYEP